MFKADHEMAASEAKKWRIHYIFLLGWIALWIFIWANTELQCLTLFLVMDDVDSGLSDFIYSVLPNSSSNDLLLEALQTLGVETVEDLKYVQEADLVNTLRPIEARKLIARFKAFCKYT